MISHRKEEGKVRNEIFEKSYQRANSQGHEWSFHKHQRIRSPSSFGAPEGTSVPPLVHHGTSTLVKEKASTNKQSTSEDGRAASSGSKSLEVIRAGSTRRLIDWREMREM